MGKKVIINGFEYEGQGPFCDFCGSNMGKLYSRNADPTFTELPRYETYSRCECPKCERKYEYMERMYPVLTEKEKQLLLNKGGK